MFSVTSKIKSSFRNERFPSLLKFSLLKNISIPTCNYMFKVNNRNPRGRCEICSKLTIKTPEWRQWHHGMLLVTVATYTKIKLRELTNKIKIKNSELKILKSSNFLTFSWSANWRMELFFFFFLQINKETRISISKFNKYNLDIFLFNQH